MSKGYEFLNNSVQIYVEWDDSCTSTGWKFVDEITGIAKCVTLGFLVRENKKYITNNQPAIKYW